MRLNTAQRLALNLDSHIVIDAGAGTGKTSTIVDRVIEHYLSEDQRATRLLPKPTRPAKLRSGTISSPPSERIDLREWGGLLPGEVVLLTFTNRAADEMRDRLRKEISRLKPGPIGDNGRNRTDPRIRNQGFIEQLLTLLEDAPIGTIDSFLSQLVSPFRGKLGDALSRENVTDAGRNILVDSALRTLWRLPSAKSRIGDAVDAGIPAQIVADVLSARDRVSRSYSGSRAASRVLRGLASKSVFIDEAARKIMKEDGTVDPDLLMTKILESADEQQVKKQAEILHSIVSNICQIFKDHIQSPSSVGWPAISRMSCLDELDRSGPPVELWGKLRWMGQVLVCTVSKSTLMSKKMTFFPRNQFPSDDWAPGVESYSKISDKNTKENFLMLLKEQISSFGEIWSGETDRILLHFVRATITLENSKPPGVSDDWEPPSSPLPLFLPERLDNPRGKYHFTLEAEVRNLGDLHLLHLGFQGILKRLKEREEVHDFDDVQKLAGDLLLTNCPETCRPFYHPSIQVALDSLGERPWRDDHISRAFEALTILEGDPASSGASASLLGAIRSDLEGRYKLLREIRRRYRAFIIDEAQDNSPLQWRILSRLWGPREIGEEEPPVPDTPWQPTVCYVGDVKQSIYAFRQAEVTGFVEFAQTLRRINTHELNSVDELTRHPALRRESHSRDPRNDHSISIAKASEHMEKGGRDLVSWIPFDSTDRELPAPGRAEVRDRKEGLISLQVNYRTEGGLLGIMNEWWEDVFSDRHHLLRNGDFYASPQTLFPSPDKRGNPGSVEWICPIDTPEGDNPPIDLGTHLDPFGPGEKDRLERQAMLIALRVKSLLEGTSVRALSSNGDWRHSAEQEPIKPSEILILLPNRVKIRDIIVRHLHDMGVPTQVDIEGDILDRPTSSALEGLLQLVARPTSRHNAAWVARSCLIGMDDGQLQDFLESSKKGTNLLLQLSEKGLSERQRSLAKRWYHLSNSSNLVEILEETIDRSDLLVTYPDEVSRQDSEQFVEMVRRISLEVGGDPIVLADRIRELRERSETPLVAETTPPSDAVRVMTIHSSKGLEARVVIIADIFSNRQTNMRNEQNSRLIVSPELFAGHPNPWPSDGTYARSTIWEHVSILHRARKSAEARRLLYVAATRAEEKLIIAGSPRGSEWVEGEGIRLPWTYDTSIPQLGQMWAESLRQGSIRREEQASPWNSGSTLCTSEGTPTSGSLIIDPGLMLDRAYLGNEGNHGGMLVMHEPSCFLKEENEHQKIKTPLQRIEDIDKFSRYQPDLSGTEAPSVRNERITRVSIKPSQLPVFQDCARRQWLETRGGIDPEPVLPYASAGSSYSNPMNLDSATFGTIFHRIVEIGIGNPGPGEGAKTHPLPPSWTKSSPDLLSDESLHATVFEEMLPPSANSSEVARVAREMAERIGGGKIGELVAGREVDEHSLDGLRTEMPFNIQVPVNFDEIERSRWTPDGYETLATMDSSVIEMSGVIDLVLCTSTSSGESNIRPVDLKTEGADRLSERERTGLLDALGCTEAGPMCEAEERMLRKHRLQLALYYLALSRTEAEKMDRGIPHRDVLSPAILVGATGRLVEYPREMLQESISDLHTLLARSAKIALSSQLPIAEFPQLSGQAASACESCPFHSGMKPICGPAE